MVWMSMCQDAAAIRSEKYALYSMHTSSGAAKSMRERMFQSSASPPRPTDDPQDHNNTPPNHTTDQAVGTDACEWEEQLKTWLLIHMQPRIEGAVGCENTALRAKVNELRREIDVLLDGQDKQRQETTKLRAENDELRRDIRCLQL